MAAVTNDDLLKPLVFRSYNFLPFSKSRYLGTSAAENWQAVRASTAAPFYFDSYKYLDKELQVHISTPPESRTFRLTQCVKLPESLKGIALFCPIFKGRLETVIRESWKFFLNLIRLNHCWALSKSFIPSFVLWPVRKCIWRRKAKTKRATVSSQTFVTLSKSL